MRIRNRRRWLRLAGVTLAVFAALSLVRSDVLQPPARAVETPRALPWHLVFVNNRDGDADIYAVGASGGRIAALTRNTAKETVAGLSPDGKWILADRGSMVGALVSGDGRHERKGVGLPGAFSPDSQTVAITRWLDPEQERSRISLVTIGTGKARDLGSGTPQEFAPNGRLLSYYGTDGSLGVIDVRSGRRWRVASESIAPNYPVPMWSPSGKWLAWAHDASDSSKTRLYVVDAANPGARARAVVKGELEAAWLAGDRLGVDVYRSGSNTVADSIEFRVLDPSGRTIGPVSHTKSTSLRWSPDGRSVAYYRSAATGGGYELVVANLSTGRSRALATSNDEGLTWSPKGRLLAASVRTGVIVIDVATWTIDTLDKRGEGWSLTWTKDGTALAWLSSDGVRLAVVGSRAAHTLTISGETTIIGWARGPLPSEAPTAVPPPLPDVVASPFEVRTAGPVIEIAADGARAAVIVGPSHTDCTHVIAWKPGSSSVVRFTRPNPCSSPDDASYEYQLALKRSVLTWSGITHGNNVYRTDCRANLLRAGRTSCGTEYEIWDAEGNTDDQGNPLPNPMPDISHPPPPAETHRGVSFVVENGTIVLLRFADGQTRSLRPAGGAVDAELEDTGLFYAYMLHKGNGGRLGRVVFVPFAKLFA